MADPSTDRDERPPVAIGHVRHPANDVPKTSAFLVDLGMRRIVEKDEFAVLELRGGTHVVVAPASEPIDPGASASFDLIVDDLEATHRRYTEQGFHPTEIKPGRIHRSCVVRDPSGIDITINSTHVSDRPV